MSTEPIEERLAVLEQHLAAMELAASRAHDRGDVENAFFFAKEEVDGRKVWAQWVWCKYGVDFRKQDGQWRIWRFRCYEVARAPCDENWIAFAAHERAEYEAKLMYFGDDGKPVFLPPVDGPTVTPSQPYQIDTAQHLVPEPPQPNAEYEDTFR